VNGPKQAVGEAKMKKSLRETLKALISLKTAKSRDFRTQRYQALSKTRDFAGEAISLRSKRVGGSKNLENAPTSTNRLFRLVTP
jgi:hypothetical protein